MATTGGDRTIDVFLSHSTKDTPAVKDLAAALRARGLRPWLDVEQLVPGVPFQSEITDSLSASRCFAVFVGAEQVGSWVREELDAAIGRAAGDRSFRVFLVLLPTAPRDFDPTGLHQFLSQRTWVDLRGVDDANRSGDLLARAVRGEPLGFVDHDVDDEGVVCPYVGLRPFDVEDAEWFFGREADLQRMAEKLRRSPFLAVLGRSGSGKSSLVRAGLVAALNAGRLVPGSRRWPVRVLRPTATPLEALAAHLSELRPDLPSSQVLADLATSDVALKVLLSSRDRSEPTVFVVDQAEELYTLCESFEQRQAFTANLMHASQASGPARVVLTLRSDFYARFAELEAFSARIASNHHLVTDLDDQELRQVIVQPARLAGLTLQPGLVERMIGDVRPQPGALPLLQHALRELWERRSDRKLTHDAYAEIGGVEGALAHRADEVFAELDEVGDGPVVRRLMLDLTRIEEGSEDTKRPIVLGQLEAPAYPLERLHRVAATLADARLVTTGSDDDRHRPDGQTSVGRDSGGPTAGHDARGPAAVRVELAHEALIRSWPRLRAWIEESRDDLRSRRRIHTAAQAWDDQGRPDGLLYRDTPLAIARERLRYRGAEMTKLETEFLTRSIQREAADRARARRTRRIALVSILTALILVATATTGLYVAARRAQQTAEDSAARALAQQAQALAPQDPALAVAVAAEALTRNETPEIASALQVAHLAYGQAPGRLVRTLRGHAGTVTAASFSRDRTQVATAGQDGTVKIWDVASGEYLATLTGHRGMVRAVAFSPRQNILATAGDDGAVRIWDPSTADMLQTFTGHPDTIHGLAFSPDGTRLATAGRDGTTRLWNPNTGAPVMVLSGHTIVHAVTFSSDGTLLATAGFEGRAKLWNAATGQPLETISAHSNPVVDVEFSPDNKVFATTSTDRTVKLWAVDGGAPLGTLGGHRGHVEGVAFSPDGTTIATVSLDATMKFWHADSGDEIATLAGRHQGLVDVTFSSDGALLATTSNDGTAQMWAVDSDDEVTTLADHTGAVTSVAFSSDGRSMITASDDGTAALWNPDSGDLITRFVGHGISVLDAALDDAGTLVATAGADRTVRLWDATTGGQIVTPDADIGVNRVALGPDGGVLATAGQDGVTTLWDSATGEAVARLDGHEGAVTDVAFKPGGDLIATSSLDGTVRLWDPRTREAVRTLRGHTHHVLGVAFSPDGTVMASASLDKTAKLWDLGTGEVIATLTGHDAGLNAVAFSPDGALVATASDDGTTMLWDADTGDAITTLAGHEGKVLDVAFSPDGTRIASAGQDQTVLIRRLMLTPDDACDLVTGEVIRSNLQEALGDMAPQACTHLRRTDAAS